MMSRTHLHTFLGRWNNGIQNEVPVNVQKKWDRKNFDKSEFLVLRFKIKEKCFDSEWVKELNPHYYSDFYDNEIDY